MKKLLILLFSILISFNSYGEWEEVVESEDGDTFYIDKDTIKKHGGYVYWWEMGSYKDPYSPYEGILDQFNGSMSSKRYRKGDCNIVRFKELSVTYYDEQMGDGYGEDDPLISESDPWQYPPPDTIDGLLLDYVCDYVD